MKQSLPCYKDVVGVVARAQKETSSAKHDFRSPFPPEPPFTPPF